MIENVLNFNKLTVVIAFLTESFPFIKPFINISIRCYKMLFEKKVQNAQNSLKKLKNINLLNYL